MDLSENKYSNALQKRKNIEKKTLYDVSVTKSLYTKTTV